jgi:hypothetical protein
LRAVRGRAMLKSILMSSHFHIEVFNGCNKPVGLR